MNALRRSVLAAVSLVALSASIAHAQTSPHLVKGQVPSASDWNGYFAGKVDYSAGSGCPISSGCTGATTAGGAVTNLSLQGFTRAQIPSLHLGAGRTFVTTGFLTSHDGGFGGAYTNVGCDATNGLEVIADADGVPFCLDDSGGAERPGWFGSKLDSGASKITAPDISNNPQWRGTYAVGTSWDTVGLQEATYAAFAGASTPGVVVWNAASSNYKLNKKLFIQNGSYGINKTVTQVAASVDIEFGGPRSACLVWQGATNQPMLYWNSTAYGMVKHPCVSSSLTTTQPGDSTTAGLWTMDHVSTIGLSTQQLLIEDAFIAPGINQGGIAINPGAGGSGQGSTVVFINPEFACFDSDYALWINGANALSAQIIGGDNQGCTHDGIRSTNGSIFIRGMTFENQDAASNFTPHTSQLTMGGADFHNIGDFGGFSAQNKMEDIRSESSVGVQGDSGGSNIYVDDFQVADGLLLSWFASFPYQAGMDAQVTSNGAAHAIMVVDDGGPSGGASGGWFLPVASGTDTTHLCDTTQSWTTNQWVGYTLNYRFSNGFTAQQTIASNTATCVTLTGSIGFNMASGLPAVLYHISGQSGGSTPSWNSLSPGHVIDNLNGSIGYGFVTTANSAVVVSNNAAAIVAANDYVMIPGADEITNAGNTMIMPLYAKVVSVAGANITLNRAAKISVGSGGIGVFGFTATPFTDNKLKWIDLPFNAFYGISDLKNSFAAAGNATNIGNLENSNGSWTSFNQGPTSTPAISPAQNATYGVTSQNIVTIGPAWAGGTIDLTSSVQTGNVIKATLSASSTITIPTSALLPLFMSRDLTLVITTTSSPATLTFGTGFDTTTPAFSSTAAGVYTFKFVYDGTAHWEQVAGPNLPATPSFANQTANTVLSGPASGGAAAPAFRALVANDLPTVPSSKGGSRLIKVGHLSAANFNITTDQAISLTGPSLYVLAGVSIGNCSASLTTAKGAFYSAASKTNPIWSGTTTTPYTGLDGAAGRAELLGFAAGQNAAANGGSTFAYTGPTTIYLSLTTAQGGAATCDLDVLAYDLS